MPAYIDLFNLLFKLDTNFLCAWSCWSANSPRSGAEEVHGGGQGGLEPPGGAGAAAGDTEGGGGDSGVCIASSQAVVVCMEGPGQTGKTPLCHHPQLWKERNMNRNAKSDIFR